MADELSVTSCGAERAEDVHRLTQIAFGPYAALDPPSSVGRESLDDVARDLVVGGGAIAEWDGRTVGCLRWELEGDGELYARRVAVEPELQGRGVGQALMAWAEAEALRRGCSVISVGVRVALPGNRKFFERLGFVVYEEARHEGYAYTTWLKLRKTLHI